MEINPGEITKTVYTLIKKNKYLEAIDVVLSIPGADLTRAGLSILGHCYYCTQDFQSAANCYEQLVLTCPEISDYKFYYAQSLYQASLYEKAFKVANEVNDEDHQLEVSICKTSPSDNNREFTLAEFILSLDTSTTPNSSVFCFGRLGQM